MYSDLYLQEKRRLGIPKVFLVGIVALAALVSSQAYMWYASVPTIAKEVTVKKFQIVNTSNSSFGLFLETQEPTNIFAVYGKKDGKLNNSLYESTDNPNLQTQKKYHLFGFEGLEPNTEYEFQLVSDKRLLEYGGKTDFTALTVALEAVVKPSAKSPIYGKIMTPGGEGIAGAYLLVYGHDPDDKDKIGSNVYLTSTKESGEWLYSLPSFYAPSDIINIEIFHEDYPPSKIRTLVSKASPMQQTTIIGTDYTFIETADVLGVEDNQMPSTTGESHVISILYPEKNAIIPDSKPLFKGYGVPNTLVSIEVNSKPVFRSQTTIDAKGKWTFESSRAFAPGVYNLVVKIQDTRGETRSLLRSFVIAKSGEQVLGESTISTPSGTMTPTSGVIISASPSPTIFQTSPTQAPIVTIVTATPYVTIQVPVSPTPPAELHKAGIEFPLWLPIFGALLVIVGYYFVRQSSRYSY